MAGMELEEQDEFNIMDFNKKWTIHDTIWEGKKKLIKDFGRLKIIDNHAIQVGINQCSKIACFVQITTGKIYESNSSAYLQKMIANKMMYTLRTNMA